MKIARLIVAFLLLIPSLPLAAEESTEDLCEFEQPRVSVEYWPVLIEDPLASKEGELPVIDIFMNREGVPTRHATVSAGDEENRSILRFTAQTLRFSPAYACGEPVDGFYRHSVQSYFFPDKKAAGEIDVLPNSQFVLPSIVIETLKSATFYMEDKEFELSFLLTEDGKATKIKGKSTTDKALVKLFMDKFLSSISFSPAMSEGNPVAVKMHLNINLNPVMPKAFLGRSLMKPMPKRPADGSYEEGKAYSILLDFYPNGGVKNVQYLTVMNEQESFAALSAFRKWQIAALPEGSRGGKQMKVSFTYASDEESAILLSEDFREFHLMPKLVKRKYPVYPPQLNRKGISGTAVLKFVVDKKGKTRNIEVIHATHSDFGRAAAIAAKDWEFDPGTVDGKVVNMLVRISIPFKVSDS